MIQVVVSVHETDVIAANFVNSPRIHIDREGVAMNFTALLGVTHQWLRRKAVFAATAGHCSPFIGSSLAALMIWSRRRGDWRKPMP
jgi:hypothetical protein